MREIERSATASQATIIETVNSLNHLRNVLATRAQISQPVLTGKVLAKISGGTSSSKKKGGDRFDPSASALAQAAAVAGPLDLPAAAGIARTDGILAARRAAAPAAPGVRASQPIDGENPAPASP